MLYIKSCHSLLEGGAGRGRAFEREEVTFMIGSGWGKGIARFSGDPGPKFPLAASGGYTLAIAATAVNAQRITVCARSQ
jgi:hypothetical protein